MQTQPVEGALVREEYEYSYIEGWGRGTAESRWRSGRRVCEARAERSRCHDNAVSTADSTHSSSPTLCNIHEHTHTHVLAGVISAGIDPFCQFFRRPYNKDKPAQNYFTKLDLLVIADGHNYHSIVTASHGTRNQSYDRRPVTVTHAKRSFYTDWPTPFLGKSAG